MMAMRYVIVLATVLTVIYAYAESEPVDLSAPQQMLVAPALSSEIASQENKSLILTNSAEKPDLFASSQVQTRNKRAPILLTKALLGAGVLGAGALGAGVVGAGVLGAGALGVGALGVGAGLYKAKYLGGGYGYGHGYPQYYPNNHYHNHYHSYPSYHNYYPHYHHHGYGPGYGYW